MVEAPQGNSIKMPQLPVLKSEPGPTVQSMPVMGAGPPAGGVPIVDLGGGNHQGEKEEKDQEEQYKHPVELLHKLEIFL